MRLDGKRQNARHSTRRSGKEAWTRKHLKRLLFFVLLLGSLGIFLFYSRGGSSVGRHHGSRMFFWVGSRFDVGKPPEMPWSQWALVWSGRREGAPSKPIWYTCWWGKVQESRSVRTWYVTVKTEGGAEMHRNQIVDAAVVAYATNSTFVIPQIKEAENEPNANFADLYDTRHFVKSFTGVMRVASRISDELTGHLVEVVTPALPTRAWIEENVLPLLKSGFAVQVVPVGRKGVNSSVLGEDPSLDAVRCFVAYYALIQSDTIRRLGERMLERMREAAEEGGGKFIALDMRGGTSGLRAKNCPKMPNDIGRGWHLPDDEKLRRMALKKQRTRDNKCAASPDDVERFLLALGYPKSTGIYNTASRYDKYLSTVGEYYFNTVTKDYTMPFNEETQFWWSGKSQVESGLDIYMCVHADVFVSAVPGIFRNVIVALRKLEGRFPVQPVSTLSLFDIMSLTTREAHGMIWEMYEENLRAAAKGSHHKAADVIDNQEAMCLCHEPSPFSPPPSPPRAAVKRASGSASRPGNEAVKPQPKAGEGAPAPKEGGEESSKARDPRKGKGGAQETTDGDNGAQTPGSGEKDTGSTSKEANREEGKGDLDKSGEDSKDGTAAEGPGAGGEEREDHGDVDKERREDGAKKSRTDKSGEENGAVDEGGEASNGGVETLVEERKDEARVEEESSESQEETSGTLRGKGSKGVEGRVDSSHDRGEDAGVKDKGWDEGDKVDSGDEAKARDGGTRQSFKDNGHREESYSSQVEGKMKSKKEKVVHATKEKWKERDKSSGKVGQKEGDELWEKNEMQSKGDAKKKKEKDVEKKKKTSSG